MIHPRSLSGKIIVMQLSLRPGLKYTHSFVIPVSKTVPSLYPESDEFIQMPEVFATGFLVGFLEWTCIMCINPYLDWPNEQSVGTHIDVTHEAATPPGFEVSASVELVEVDGRKLVFDVEAHDGVDLISRGRHERFIINKEKFEKKLNEKQHSHLNDVMI
jgi:fluoroacetyl-CoA thioesterase